MKLSLKLTIRAIIIGLLVFFSVGLSKLTGRIDDITIIHDRTYSVIYDSDQYDILPESGRIGLEQVKNRLLYAKKVVDSLYHIFLSFVILISLLALLDVGIDLQAFFVQRKKGT